MISVEIQDMEAILTQAISRAEHAHNTLLAANRAPNEADFLADLTRVESDLRGLFDAIHALRGLATNEEHHDDTEARLRSADNDDPLLEVRSAGHG